jgi:hypothetical protein
MGKSRGGSGRRFGPTGTAHRAILGLFVVLTGMSSLMCNRGTRLPVLADAIDGAHVAGLSEGQEGVRGTTTGNSFKNTLALHRWSPLEQAAPGYMDGA